MDPITNKLQIGFICFNPKVEKITIHLTRDVAMCDIKIYSQETWWQIV
jgi:hypothetical protein